MIAGYLCACYPPFLYAAADFGSTTLYLFFLGIVWMLVPVSLNKKSILRVAIGGFAAAGLSLIRADGIFIACGLAAWLVFRGSLPHAVIFLFVILIGISPWLVRNYFVFDRIVPMTTSFGFNFWRGHNPIASGSGRENSG